ncbi:MAG TPA: SDR family oxidoreductase [Polyangiales bacterium]
MKIVVIGGSGLIGSKLVKACRAQGHEAISASLDSGVNTLTGEGLAQSLTGASVLVDVSNSPSFEDEAVMQFFQTSTGNLLAGAAAAGLGHYVALSIVGAEGLPDSGYLRAKVAQEALIKKSSLPYSIVQSTQFFEFVKSIAAAATGHDNVVRVPPVLLQPIAGDDVAEALAEIALGQARRGALEIAGPEQIPFDAFMGRGLRAYRDTRKVIPDPRARYFGTELKERSLVPRAPSWLGKLRFDAWLSQLEP